MDEEKKTEEGKQQEEVENNIVIETSEDDYKALGIEKEQEPKEISTPPKEEAKEKPKRKSRSQRRIERLAKENQELNERLEKLETKVTVEKPPKPDAEDFENYEDYEKALEEFNKPAEKAIESPKKPKADVRIAEMMEDGIADYEDFNELVGAADLALTQTILDEVLESETPSDVAYYLATHKDKTKELSSKGKREIAKEILKIELEIENKPVQKVKTTSAPEPISPVSGGSEKVRTAETATDFEEYQKLRAQQAQRQSW